MHLKIEEEIAITVQHVFSNTTSHWFLGRSSRPMRSAQFKNGQLDRLGMRAGRSEDVTCRGQHLCLAARRAVVPYYCGNTFMVLSEAGAVYELMEKQRSSSTVVGRGQI